MTRRDQVIGEVSTTCINLWFPELRTYSVECRLLDECVLWEFLDRSTEDEVYLKCDLSIIVRCVVFNRHSNQSVDGTPFNVVIQAHC